MARSTIGNGCNKRYKKKITGLLDLCDSKIAFFERFEAWDEFVRVKKEVNVKVLVDEVEGFLE